MRPWSSARAAIASCSSPRHAIRRAPFRKPSTARSTSESTARRLRDAFPRLTVSTIVVYPGVASSDCPDLPDEPPPGPITILAVGRFSPEKRLELAVDAFARLRDRMAPPAFARMRLVLA